MSIALCNRIGIMAEWKTDISKKGEEEVSVYSVTSYAIQLVFLFGEKISNGRQMSGGRE